MAFDFLPFWKTCSLSISTIMFLLYFIWHLLIYPSSLDILEVPLHLPCYLHSHSAIYHQNICVYFTWSLYSNHWYRLWITRDPALSPPALHCSQPLKITYLLFSIHWQISASLLLSIQCVILSNSMLLKDFWKSKTHTLFILIYIKMRAPSNFFPYLVPVADIKAVVTGKDCPHMREKSALKQNKVHCVFVCLCLDRSIVGV